MKSSGLSLTLLGIIGGAAEFGIDGVAVCVLTSVGVDLDPCIT